MMVLSQSYRFRWIVCQLEALRRCFPFAICRTLDDLPRSLDETYDRILLGIAHERQEYAQRLFQCLSVSFRPLRVEELAEILSIQFDAGAVPNYDANWRAENPEEAVLSACSTLITIVDVDGARIVQFSHFSVEEYLTSERLANAGGHLSQYHILPRSAHTILAQASLSALLSLDDMVDKTSMNNFPLAIYAARYWVDHAQFDNVSSSIKEAMQRLFDSAKPHFATWVWVYDIDYPSREIMFAAHPTPPEAVPLYYATLCGFRGVVKHLIVIRPQDVSAEGGYYCTPLHAAIFNGNIDIMRLLLEHGADATAFPVNFYGISTPQSPLHEATRRGRLDMMELLLDNHADVNVQDRRGRTQLFEASLGGDLEVAQLLLRHGAASDTHDVDGWTPLMAAAHNGHSDIVHLLLQRNAAVDSSENGGWTSLAITSQFGHLDIVRLLLESGAAVDSCDENGWTPLAVASRHGHPDIVHLLLQSGAAADSSDNDGWTPLAVASRHGHPDIVHLLLQSGTSVDSRNNDGDTPLAIASQHGHPEIVRLLLQNGAAVGSRTDNGLTPSGGAS